MSKKRKITAKSSKFESEQLVSRELEVVWPEGFIDLLTSVPKVTRRLLTSEEDRDYVRGWHDYASRGQQHQKEWAKQQALKAEWSPLGHLCILAAQAAARGLDWPVFWTRFEDMAVARLGWKRSSKTHP